jgi:hypothetical protein
MSSRKAWAMIQTPPSGAPFSFRDWYDMVQAICKCEIVKYGAGVADQKNWDAWTDLTRRFILACFAYEADYELLRPLFRLPR